MNIAPQPPHDWRSDISQQMHEALVTSIKDYVFVKNRPGEPDDSLRVQAADLEEKIFLESKNAMDFMERLRSLGVSPKDRAGSGGSIEDMYWRKHEVLRKYLQEIRQREADVPSQYKERVRSFVRILSQNRASRVIPISIQDMKDIQDVEKFVRRVEEARQRSSSFSATTTTTTTSSSSAITVPISTSGPSRAIPASSSTTSTAATATTPVRPGMHSSVSYTSPSSISSSGGGGSSSGSGSGSGSKTNVKSPFGVFCDRLCALEDSDPRRLQFLRSELWALCAECEALPSGWRVPCVCQGRNRSGHKHECICAFHCHDRANAVLDVGKGSMESRTDPKPCVFECDDEGNPLPSALSNLKAPTRGASSAKRVASSSERDRSSQKRLRPSEATMNAYSVVARRLLATLSKDLQNIQFKDGGSLPSLPPKSD